MNYFPNNLPQKAPGNAPASVTQWSCADTIARDRGAGKPLIIRLVADVLHRQHAFVLTRLVSQSFDSERAAACQLLASRSSPAK
jgi:hypothetical protein